MGRHKKVVDLGGGIDRRSVGYYSTPDFVAQFFADFVESLNLDIRKVVDPCVGKEELISCFLEKSYQSYTYDLIDYGVHRSDYFVKRDFLDVYREWKLQDLPIFSSSSPLNDRSVFVANPPYNCHEISYIKENKSWLKILFGETGVHNMYSMFMHAIVDMASDRSFICFIVMDSFLTHRAHEGLRKFILDNCAVRFLSLCPTDLFSDQKAEVRTCIMVLEKGGDNTPFPILERLPSTAEFRSALEAGQFHHVSIDDVLLDGAQDRCEIVVGCPATIKCLFNNDRLGQRFRCVTGISTGNDKVYLSKVKSDSHSIPFYKNPGKRKFYSQPDAYLCDDFESIEKVNRSFMVRNKNFMFRHGISCSSMGVSFSASYLPPDSAFGVNANIFCDESDLWWLMAYLNSALVTYLVRGVLLRSNMITSGYVSRIPLLDISEDVKSELAAIAKSCYRKKGLSIDNELAQINALVFGESGLPESDIQRLIRFSTDLIRLS